MTSFNEFSAALQRLGEEQEKRQLAHLAVLEAGLPGAIAVLNIMPASELLDRLVEFSAGRNDPREMVLRDEYAQAIRTELLRRMS